MLTLKLPEGSTKPHMSQPINRGVLLEPQVDYHQLVPGFQHGHSYSYRCHGFINVPISQIPCNKYIYIILADERRSHPIPKDDDQFND